MFKTRKAWRDPYVDMELVSLRKTIDCRVEAAPIFKDGYLYVMVSEKWIRVKAEEHSPGDP